MNFTKRTEYALRALIEIGNSKNNKPVKRSNIAKNQDISAQFLEQVFLPLMKNDIIRSIRGPGGGFILNKSADKITVWDIYNSVEKVTKLASDSKSSKKGDLAITNKIQNVWQSVDDGLFETMQSITLDKIINSEVAKKSDTKNSLFELYNPIDDNLFQIIDDSGKVINRQWVGSIKDDELLKAYKFMQYVRTADEMCISYQRQGRLYTFPPNLGQEAISTATGFVQKKDDWIIPAYREVAAWLLKGAALKDIFLLWGGNEIGATFSGAENILPVSVPIASQLPHAVGIAFAKKYKNEKGVVFAFVGDGGTSEGDFHEALNFAAVWKVPVVFIIQNNQYAISVPVKHQTASKNLAIKSMAYGMPGIKVDGNDFLAMHRVLTEAKDYANSGNGPALVEAVTYRKGAHTTSDDPTLYRTDEEEKNWAEKDPIKRLRGYLVKKKKWKAADDKTLIDSYKKEVDAEFLDYEKTPVYKLNDVFDYMYAEIPETLKKQKIKYEKYLNWKRSNK